MAWNENFRALLLVELCRKTGVKKRHLNGGMRALFCTLTPFGFPVLQELSSQLNSQGKVDPASLQALATALAQQNLGAAEKVDLEQYQSWVQAWEAEKRQLILRENEMREKAEHEKQQRLAAKAAAQRV